jgi:sporadic carbohydrate cluster protein (TIGR04323 family)
VSRPLLHAQYSQRVQNLVIRDLAQRRGLRYLLSGTEHAMPGCYMILEGILRELCSVEGIIFFSAFALPSSARRRRAIYERVLAEDCVLHFALENLSIARIEDIDSVEELLLCVGILANVPFDGRYEKPAGEPLASHIMIRALLTDGSAVTMSGNTEGI